MTTQLLTTLYATLGEGNFENDVALATQVFNASASNNMAPSFTASVDSAVTSLLMPLTVQFADTSTGTPTAWAWNFGDGASATTQNPSHTYVDEGVYDVTLTVTNANGSVSVIQSGCVIVTGTIQQPITQVVEGAPESAVSFTASATSGTHPLSVTFTDTSTNSPYNWSWDFGDGAKSTAQNPVHIFDHAGTFGVTLQVVNAGGIKTSAPMTITVA